MNEINSTGMSILQIRSFLIQVQMLAITVELLLGDIPDRAVFRTPTMMKTLAPYFQLTQGTY